MSDSELMTDGRPRRRSERSLRRRAYKHAAGWETPTYKLGEYDADRRVSNAWLAGYEAARRDARRDR